MLRMLCEEQPLPQGRMSVSADRKSTRLGSAAVTPKGIRWRAMANDSANTSMRSSLWIRV